MITKWPDRLRIRIFRVWKVQKNKADRLCIRDVTMDHGATQKLHPNTSALLKKKNSSGVLARQGASRLQSNVKQDEMNSETTSFIFILTEQVWSDQVSKTSNVHIHHTLS